jgi:transposase
MQLHTIGIDLGKTVFHLVGLNLRGEVVVRKKFSRKQLLHFTANLQVELIGMEACGGSHFLGRALREQGHEGAADAGAVCQAVRKDEQERLH